MCFSSFCNVRQNTHFICQCQLISSRTSESCYEHFFLLLILYKDTKVHLAKVAKQFKNTQSCRGISMAWFCCLVGVCWFVSFPKAKQSPVLCAHETSFRKDTKWALCYVFYVFCHVRTLSLVFLSILSNFLACKSAFCMFLATIQIHKSPMSSLPNVLGMQVASLCQSLSRKDRVCLGHSDHEMTDF